MLHLTTATCLRPNAMRTPRPLHGVAATRALEQAVAAQLPPHALMQRAGLALARLAQALAPHAGRLWLACGPGNNGGDGLEAAMHLKRWGRPVCVTWLGHPDTAPADARASWQRAVDAGVPFVDAPPPLDASDLAIDAVLGIGSRRAPEGRLADALHAMATSTALVLCVDLPSGLDADTGQPAAVDATPWWQAHPAGRRHTLSLLTLKPGQFTAAGRDACGELWFHDLGIRQDTAADIEPSAWLNAPPPQASRLHASHKGLHGDVAVVGGAAGMSGAAVLAAQAALHAGAGRVFLQWLEAPLQAPVLAPDLMLRPWAGEAAAATLACGCGGGDAVHAALPVLLSRTPRLVLDADALNAIAADPMLQALLIARARHASQATVLTPHPLEAARLLGTRSADVQADRLAAARALVQRYGACVLLKGSGSVIAAPDQPLCINPSGNARLATGGTGDVLAGLLAARLAQAPAADGHTAFNAACAAAWEHGLAAEQADPRRALTASSLAEAMRPPGDRTQS